MESDSRYVTKKELYTVAVNVCGLVMFTGMLSDREGFWNLYIAFWALALILYYSYKLRKAKSNSTLSDSNSN